ncbi:MAG TPA: phosphoribosyltransferase family protein [Candidatus Saccharimonadales bacterium]|nr:phosphoribosyltransferase family protein [Candidatus Saccharimonadales bacterium]
MYFENREQAGQILAAELVDKYRYEDCTVVALSDGAVVVGEQIAKALHCLLTMLLVEEIQVPGENISFGSVSQNGGFTYNNMFSVGEIEEYNSEYHGYLEEQKRQAFQSLNRLLGDGGFIDESMLRDRVVILVADGFDTGSSLDASLDFLKPIRIKRLVVATPVSAVQAVDRLHIAADEIHILDVKENFLGIDHYYNKNNIPSHEETIAKINQIVLNWK